MQIPYIVIALWDVSLTKTVQWNSNVTLMTMAYLRQLLQWKGNKEKPHIHLKDSQKYNKINVYKRLKIRSKAKKKKTHTHLKDFEKYKKLNVYKRLKNRSKQDKNTEYYLLYPRTTIPQSETLFIKNYKKNRQSSQGNWSASSF